MFKLYHFSPRSLEFVEARWCRARLAVLSTILAAAVLAIGFEANQHYGDALGLGVQRDKTLRAENTVLRNQLRAFTRNLRSIDETLTSLSDRGDELRLTVDLPKIGEDTRKAGFGGTDERIDFGVGTEFNNMVNNLRTAMTKAERVLQLEQTIFHEAAAKVEQNTKMYPCLPAIKPMEGYYSMTGYGMRYHPVFHQMLLHEGLDIANPEGTPVHATGDGVVIMAGRTTSGLGTMVVINHGFGYTTVYGHLSKVLVRSGERVKRGTLIARSGSTGIVTGPHLHYEVRHNGRLQNPVDHFLDGSDFREIAERKVSAQ